MTVRSWPARDLVEGGTWGLVVGTLGGVALAGGTVTAEAGQMVWLMTIAAGAVVISPAREASVGGLVGACLPFFLAVCGVFLWTGAAALAWFAGEAVLVSHVPIPAAAYTGRELALRRGLFFLFVLGASLPAAIGALIVYQGAARTALRLAAGMGAGTGGIARAAVRLTVCAGMLALAAIS